MRRWFSPFFLYLEVNGRLWVLGNREAAEAFHASFDD